MKTFVSTIIALTFTLLAAAPALADHKRHWDYGWNDRPQYQSKYYHQPRHREYQSRRDNDGLAVALGIIAGSIITGTILHSNQQRTNNRYQRRALPCGGYDHPDPARQCAYGHELLGPVW